MAGASAGKEDQLRFLCSELWQAYPPPGQIRYHRTVSAVLEAKRFGASEAAMVVHSFSPMNEWLGDYQAFLRMFGLLDEVDQAVTLRVEFGLKRHFALRCVFHSIRPPSPRLSGRLIQRNPAT